MSGNGLKMGKKSTKKVVYLIDYQIDDSILLLRLGDYLEYFPNQSLALTINKIPAMIIVNEISSACVG